MLLTEFDPDRNAVINPDILHKPVEGFPETVVSIFSHHLFQRIVTLLNGRIIAETHDVDGIWPVYEVIYKIQELVDMLKSYFEALPETAKYTNELETKNQHLLKAINYIKQNFNNPITVEDIANVCFVSPSYLQHIFSKHRGHGINEEITRERLQYAEELLTSTDRQIKDIAYSSGFSNSDYFCTVFKKHYKVSPLKYRKSHSNKK